MVSTSNSKPPAPSVFVIRVTDPAQDHKLLGYAFVQQTAFFAAEGDAQPPEVRITLDGLRQLFEKSGEYALAAVPFVAEIDRDTGTMMLGAQVEP